MALSITKPTVGGSEDTWGTTINTALDDIVSYANTAPQLGDANVFTETQTIQKAGDTLQIIKATSSGAGNDDDAILRLDSAETGECLIDFWYDGVIQNANIEYVPATTQLNLNVPSGGSIDFQVNSALIGRASATGFLPGSDNTYDLGGPSDRWDDVYATNGTINTSDARQKRDIEELDEAERRVAVRAKALLRKYRWKDAVANSGDGARIHIGIMAQDLIRAFDDEGLDAFKYAMIVGNEEDGYGVRYHELLAFIIAAW